MIVRDLLISFGAKFDKNSARQVEGQARNVAQGVKGMFNAFLGFQFLHIFKNAILGMTAMASAVDENANVMNAAFGENQKAVSDWAATFGDAAGRSRYELEQMAGSLGAMLNPLMEQNAELSAEMSSGLTELAVDLASFFNTTDEAALLSIRAGLIGSTEPMRKFGVVMTQASLDAFALEKGIKGNTKSMSEAEKVSLRYQFIMEKTVNAQGDAIKTAAGFANASKALRSKISEVGVEIGKQLIPVMGWLVLRGREVVTWFAKVARETNIIKSAMIALGGIALIVGAKMLAPFLPLILIVGALILVIDELWTFLEGGNSVIGAFIDWLVGPGGGKAAAEGLKQALTDLGQYFVDVLVPAFVSAKDKIVEFAKTAAPYVKQFALDTGEAFMWLWDNVLVPYFGWLIDTAVPAVIEFVQTVLPYWKALIDIIGEGLGWAWENVIKPLFGFLLSTAIPVMVAFGGALSDILGPAVEGAIGFFSTLFGWLVKVVDKVGDFMEVAAEAAESAAKFLGFDLDLTPEVKGTIGRAGAFAPPQAGPNLGSSFRVPIPSSSIGAVTTNNNSQSSASTINENVTVNLNGPTTPAAATKVAESTSDEMRKMNRRTAAALRQRKS